MKNIAFDALTYSKEAQAVGFSVPQAEFQARQLAKLVDEELVTKSYLDFRLEILESKLENKFNSIDNKFDLFDSKIERIKNDILIKLGTMMFAGFGLTIAILGFIIKH